MADPVTIISHVANACQITFTDPMLGIAWARTVFGEMPVDIFMALVKALNPMDMDKVVNIQHLVDYCMGAAA
jgi:hypothetical protein